jgi:hypothetical protein
MLPTGTPRLALTSAYDSAGSSMSRASSCWHPWGQLPERLTQGRVPLGREQARLGRLGVIVRDDPGGQRMTGVAGSAGGAQDAAAFAPG